LARARGPNSRSSCGTPYVAQIARPGTLLAAQRADPGLTLAELAALALERLEFARIATRVAPMLGLVATMIPMGPALKALGDG